MRIPALARNCRRPPNSKSQHVTFESAHYLILILIAICAGQAAAANVARVAGELLVQIDRGSDAKSVGNALSDFQLSPRRLLSARLNIWLYDFSDAPGDTIRTKVLIESLRKAKGVQRAQFNHYVTERSALPNDPLYGQQWSLENTAQTGGTPDADIDAPEAWDLTTGGTTCEGDEIVIAVIDNGFDLLHQDLSFWKNTEEIPANGIDDDNNGYIDDYDGWNAINSNGVIASNLHGTHVSGIAAAKGNNGIGVSGVNWGAEVLPVVGISRTEAVVVEAYGYVLEMRARYNESNGVDGAFIVSSNSSFGIDFGQPEDYPLWCAIYDSLGQQGILNAGATANLNIDVDAVGDIPTGCASEFLITVTNTTDTDARNSGAAFGLTTIDLGAPGTDILNTIPGGGYSSLTGCSMATPHVAGTIALMWSAACPRLLTDYRYNPAVTALLMKDLLLQGTDPVPALAGLTVTGGRLNALNAILLVKALRCGVSIKHTPMVDTRDTAVAYRIEVIITADTTLVANSLLLHYRLADDWVSTPLNTAEDAMEFSAEIPAQSPGAEIEYYLEAHASDGSADTTSLFTFHVIDFDVALSIQTTALSGAVGDTLVFPFTLLNSGLIADRYYILQSESEWETNVVKLPGGTVLDTTDIIRADSSLDFAIIVVVPETEFGSSDICELEVKSLADATTTDGFSTKSISAGHPIGIPLADEFVVESINDSIWPFVTEATIDSLATNEPSQPYSLRLNGFGFSSDTIRTRSVDLRGLSGASLDYYFQQRGGGDDPEAGDDLLVEYFNWHGEWSLFRRHFGSSMINGGFQRLSAGLPLDAYHAAFAVRVRNIVTGGGDDWFIDDFTVDIGPQLQLSTTLISDTVYTNDSTENILIIRNDGALSMDYSLTAQLTSSSPRFWPAFSQIAGVVMPFEADTIVVTMIGTEMALGTYTADVICHNNDADAADTAAVISLAMIVSAPPLPYDCGDADGNRMITISDVVFIVVFIFSGGTAPEYFLSADANCDNGVTVSDAVYLINYIFGGGPSPCLSCN